MADNIIERLLKPSPRGRIWQIFALIIILTIVGGLIDAGSYYNKGVDWVSGKTNNSLNLPKTKETPFKLGLDLQGGTHLVYKADVSQVPKGDEESAVEGVRDVIERRVNVFGVSEPMIQVNKTAEGDFRIIAELAGIKDVNEAIKMIGETPLLEFKESALSRDLTEEEQIKIDELNAAANTKAEEALGKLLSNANFESIVAEYDEREDESKKQEHWINAETDRELVEKVKELEIGKISDIITLSNGLSIVNLKETRTETNEEGKEKLEQVKASHLLICHNESERCESELTKEEALAKIKQIKEEATPENFSELVKQYSQEPGAAETAGELGWFYRDDMVAPFSDTAFDNQEVGSISYVVETMFGYHLIYKQDEKKMTGYKVQDLFIATQGRDDVIDLSGGTWTNTKLTGKYLKRATIQFNPSNNLPEVSLEFDGEGSDLFEEITERNIGRPVGIFLDGINISSPVVSSKISGGKAVINGNFTLEEVDALVRSLNAGALPIPIELISQKTVGASLGKMSIENSLKAGMLGLILVIIFMVFYYRLPGLIAVISLAIYGILLLAIFKLWNVTLTLSGLAGFILSIGMAVDANVLIFERFKEEIKAGRSTSKAIDLGFKRAWTSIRDGNVSTLITCFILIQFSTSVVKGFAITLFLGVLVSMFSAIIVTKNLLLLIPEKFLENKFLSGYKK